MRRSERLKSERLKKLENELNDLEQWQQLGLVPKKDINRHKEEIKALSAKIEEERERLEFLKGEDEEFIVPKRSPGKVHFGDMPTIPGEEEGGASGMTEFGYEDRTTPEYTALEDENSKASAQQEGADDFEFASGRTYTDDYFSDENRWKRGSKDIVDPDAEEL